MFERHPERLILETKPGVWYVFAEKTDTPHTGVEWLSNAEAYGPFEEEEMAADFLKKYIDPDGHYWTTAYDPARDVPTAQFLLMQQAEHKTAIMLRQHMKVVSPPSQ